MSKTAIIYWSGTGNTEAMARAVLEGAKEVNSETKFFYLCRWESKYLYYGYILNFLAFYA